MVKNGKIQVSKFFARRTEAPSDAVWTVLAAVVCAGAAAAQPTSPPNLSPHNVTGWVPLNYGDSFVSPADGPGPVVDDPRYPFVSNQTSARTGKRSTFHIADLNNPILQPWAMEELRKRNEWILSGKPGKYPFIALSKLLHGPGLEDRVVQVGDVECRSLSRACRCLVAYERVARVVHDRAGSVRWRNKTVAIIQRHPPGDIVR